MGYLVCYKSTSPVNAEVEELFETIEEASKSHVLIMGDFNFPE